MSYTFTATRRFFLAGPRALSAGLSSMLAAFGQRGPGYDPTPPTSPAAPDRKSYPGIRRHSIIYYDAYAYSSWPSILRCKDGELLIAFSTKTRRKAAITHVDPSFWNVIIRSGDDGRSWSEFPEMIGGYNYFGMDDPGIAQISDGRILVNSCWRTFIPASAADRRTDRRFTRVSPFPWAYASGPKDTFVFHSLDNGRTWLDSVRLDVRPFRSGWTLRPIVELPDGTLLLPCYEEEFGPAERGLSCSAFVMRSVDRGRSWAAPALVAGQGEIGFNEPSLLCLPNGRIIALMRTMPAAHLYQSVSEDGGRTWTRPQRTPIWGYPADLRLLKDGRVLASYGYRRPPYGIRACLSEDSGRSWPIKNEIVLRDDFPNTDLGYPTTAELADGTLLTAYYGRDVNNDVTCIQGTFWKPMG